jgi:hypothetical protein
MWTARFWKQAGERAARAAAASFLTIFGNEALNIITLDYGQALGLMAGAAVASLAMSVVASGVGDKGTAAFTRDGA